MIATTLTGGVDLHVNCFALHRWCCHMQISCTRHYYGRSLPVQVCQDLKQLLNYII